MSIYTDYYSAIEDTAQFGLGIVGTFFLFGILSFILSIAISVIMIISLWKIFIKLGKEGWISLIPFYNTWVLLETQGIKGWWSLIPFANIVFLCMAYYKLAISFGKSNGFAILTIFFPYVCLPLLAFAKNKNNSSQNTTANNNFNQQNNMNSNNQTLEVNNNINSNELNNINQPTNIETINNQTANTKICPNCNTHNITNSNFCINCGTKL